MDGWRNLSCTQAKYNSAKNIYVLQKTTRGWAIHRLEKGI